MTKFHVNFKGNTNECDASVQDCPFGEERHFETKKEAQKFFESTQESTPPVLSKSNFSLPISESLQEAIDDLSEVGEPYIVGGAVRDAFLGAKNKDIDLEIHESNIDVIVEHLQGKGYKVDEVGKQFGVLKVSRGKELQDLDVSVPRRENRTGAGHRSFDVSLDTLTVEEAVERRDFTFNAIMYNPETKKIIDPAGGEQDLKNKTLRHVSDKFSEDPLRVMRGFQFAARFDLEYSPETAEFARSIRSEYSTCAKEMYAEEWGKFYTKGINHLAGIKALQDSGWDNTQPELRESLQNPKTLTSLNNLSDARQDLKGAIGAAIISESMTTTNAKGFINTTTHNKNEARLAGEFNRARITSLSTTFNRKDFAKNGKVTFRDLEEYAKVTNNSKLVKACREAEAEGVYDKPETDLVNGNQIMEATGKQGGKWMGEVLNKMRNQQYAGKLTNEKDALAYAVRMSKETD